MALHRYQREECMMMLNLQPVKIKVTFSSDVSFTELAVPGCYQLCGSFTDIYQTEGSYPRGGHYTLWVKHLPLVLNTMLNMLHRVIAKTICT